MRIMTATCFLVFSLSTSAATYKTPVDDNKPNSILPNFIIDLLIKHLYPKKDNKLKSSKNPDLAELPRGLTDLRIFNGTTGVRYSSGKAPLIAAITPRHAGLTLREQPTLYWFTSQLMQDNSTGEPLDLEFVLNSDESTSPVLRIPIVVSQSGFQSIKLSDYGIRLKPEIKYTWFVSVVPDYQKRSHDSSVKGEIQRINPSESLINDLSQSSDDKITSIYAKHGIWYDMMTSLHDAITQNPTDSQLTDTRAQLLKLVDLAEVACYQGNNMNETILCHEQTL